MRAFVIPRAVACAVALAASPALDALAASDWPYDRAAITPKYISRWPQPVRVGDLLGVPALGWELARLGTVEKVVRAADGGLNAIVRYGGPFAFLGWGGRPISLPIETLGMLGRQVMIMDIPPEKLDLWPTWAGSESELAPNDTVKVGLTKS